VRTCLEESKAVHAVGRSLYIGDADINYDTVRRALRRIDSH
jgi:hypothetical protein